MECSFYTERPWEFLDTVVYTVQYIRLPFELFIIFNNSLRFASASQHLSFQHGIRHARCRFCLVVMYKFLQTIELVVILTQATGHPTHYLFLMITSIYWRSSWSWWRHVMLVSSYNPHIQQARVYMGRPEIPLSQHPSDFDKNHKVLTYVEYRAVSGVFQNIDPPTLSPLSECVLHPHQRRYTMAGRWGWGVNILEDARHRIGLLQYI